MRKPIALFIVIFLLIGFCSCSGSKPNGAAPGEQTKQSGQTDQSGKTEAAAETEGAQTNGSAATGKTEIKDPQTTSALEDLKAGDKFTFGKWEQDGNMSNGAEPVTWIVIRQDVGKALVLSEKILEYMCMQNGTEENKYPRALYKDSDLRTFLNGEFYNNAFSGSEKAMIGTSKIVTKYKDEHYNTLTYETEDKVFPLSRDEAARYVCGVGTIVHGIPTAYVDGEHPYSSSSISGVSGVDKVMTWWLRDMSGEPSKEAAVIYASETQKYTNDLEVYKEAGVRPAMWIVYNEADANGYAEGKVQPKEDAKLNANIAALKVGGKLQFGVYDKNLYSMDGFEPLVWTVIEEYDDCYLLISDTIAGSSTYAFDDKGGDDTTWAQSSLRQLINSGAFLDMTFTPQEKAKLIITHVVSTGEDERNGGDATDDLLFIPDITEIEKYSGQISAGIGYKYWLRSQRSWAPYMAYVSGSGDVYSSRPGETYSIRLMATIKK